MLDRTVDKADVVFFLRLSIKLRFVTKLTEQYIDGLV